MIKLLKYSKIYTYFAMVAVICVLFFACTFSANAAEKNGSCGEQLTWNLSGGTLTIEGSGDMTDYADGALAPWFGVAGEIQSILLPEGMTSVGDYAFFGCRNVTSVSIPASVLEIGECSFAQCKSLIRLDFGTGVQIIGEGAFQECESLPVLNFPKNLTEIGIKAFYRCFKISSVKVPETVTVLGESAFSYCTGLVRATVNAPLEELPGWTFYGCKSLADVSLAPTIVSAGEYAFLFCENLDGIYTQGGNVKTLHALEDSIYGKDGSPKEGLLKVHTMPKDSAVEIDDGKVYTEIQATEYESMVVISKKITDYAAGQNVPVIKIEAVTDEHSDWVKLSTEVTEALSGNGTVNVEVHSLKDVIDSEALEYFVQKPVNLQIISEEGMVWEIDMKQMDLGSFSGKYSLIEMATEPYVKEEISLEELPEESGLETIPEEESSGEGPIFEPYDPEGVEDGLGESHLKDEEGTTYYVTGRSSKWGITGKQFAIYVGLWVASAVLIVAVVMMTMNQRKRSKEQYEELVRQGETEDAAAEEARQLELLKDMLNKDQE